MEISSLLLSKTMTTDVCMCIYDSLCTIKRLPIPLSEEIHSIHLLKKIIACYSYFCTNKCFVKEIDLNTLCWIENEFIGVLNDHIPLIKGLSPGFIKQYPTISAETLLDSNSGIVDEHYLFKRVLWLWILMTKTKKEEIYISTISQLKEYPEHNEMMELLDMF